MKTVRFIPASGGAADLYYKLAQFSTIFYGASGEMIVRLIRYSDNTVLEQATAAVPGAFVDVLVTVANIQRTERFYITISRSTGGSSSTTQSGATTYANPGYSESLNVTVVAYP